MSAVRKLAKRGAQSVVAMAGPHRFKFGPPRLVVLCYHRVLPRDHPDLAFEQPGMYVEPETLAMHMAVLPEFFEPVHLDDWLDAAGRGEPLPARACAVTFDDGWQDNYEFAWPVLEAAGIPSTIFIVTRKVGGDYGFWPTRLGRLLSAWRPQDARGRLDPAVLGRLESLGFPLRSERPSRDEIDRVITGFKTAGDSEIESLLDAVETQMAAKTGPSSDLMSWDQIKAMGESDQIRFGSHTRQHLRLTEGVSAADLEAEVAGSRQDLQTQLGKPVTLFCYPNGDHCASAVDAVRESYLGAVTTQRGWNDQRTDPVLLNRISLHQDVSGTRTAFLARVSGWL